MKYANSVLSNLEKKCCTKEFYYDKEGNAGKALFAHSRISSFLIQELCQERQFSLCLTSVSHRVPLKDVGTLT